jgi:hypothetical protein
MKRWSPQVLGGCALAAALAACKSAPVTPQQRELEERRLLQPYAAGGEVRCGALLIEVTPNFYPHVAQPAIDSRIHGARKEKGSGYTDTVWFNKIGDQRGAFTITIGAPDTFTEKGIVHAGAMKFTVLHEVRLRVFEHEHAMTLDATASGKPLAIDEGKGARDLAEFEVRDGVLRAR